MKYLKLLRVSHYAKNVLIFAPLFFGEKLFDIKSLLLVAYMTIPFCLISSVIYIINDISDVDNDRKHPKKCKRPIASGAVSVKQGRITATLLLLIAVVMVVCTVLMDCFCVEALILLASFFVINLLYSRGLKNVPILDVTILSAGYLIRLYYGASVIGVAVSPWLYLTVLGGAFYLGMGKRRNELQAFSEDETRKVLKKYSYAFLDKNMHVCIAFTEMAYALWTVQTGNVGLMWTVPIVMIIFMKYSLIIESDESDGNPMGVILSDKSMLILVGLYVVITFLSTYFL